MNNNFLHGLKLQTNFNTDLNLSGMQLANLRVCVCMHVYACVDIQHSLIMVTPQYFQAAHLRFNFFIKKFVQITVKTAKPLHFLVKLSKKLSVCGVTNSNNWKSDSKMRVSLDF